METAGERREANIQAVAKNYFCFLSLLSNSPFGTQRFPAVWPYHRSHTGVLPDWLARSVTQSTRHAMNVTRAKSYFFRHLLPSSKYKQLTQNSDDKP